MPKRIFIIGLLLATAFSLSAGGSAETDKPLKVGILPDADSLPFMVAGEEGLFTARGVAVELVLFHNPLERDAAFQAGEVDGIIADTIGSILFVAAGMDAAITSITSGRYGLAAAPGTNVSTVGDLIGKEVGVSSNTVIEYVASRLFTAAGLAAEDFVPLAVPKIPVRMELLLKGKLPAACLPEPLYSLVLSKGAVPLGDSTSLGIAPGVMLFRRSITETRTEELGRFYDAYWQACSAVNTDPGSYRDFLVDAMGFPSPVRQSFEFVHYDYPRLPSESEIHEAGSWMQDRDLIDTVPSLDVLCASKVLEAFTER